MFECEVQGRVVFVACVGEDAVGAADLSALEVVQLRVSEEFAEEVAALEDSRDTRKQGARRCGEVADGHTVGDHPSPG